MSVICWLLWKGLRLMNNRYFLPSFYYSVSRCPRMFPDKLLTLLLFSTQAIKHHLNNKTSLNDSLIENGFYRIDLRETVGSLILRAEM